MKNKTKILNLFNNENLFKFDSETTINKDKTFAKLKRLKDFRKTKKAAGSGKIHFQKLLITNY